MVQGVAPKFSKNRVNKAGDSIRSGDFTADDIAVIDNWRAAHNKILNDWQSILRKRCRGKDIVFAQRLKRRVTIFDKLSRKEKMNLARMHDIAGCRLIFENLSDLNEYRKKLHSSTWIRHQRRKADKTPYKYDYIDFPHPDNSGYRGIHDIYEYASRTGRPNEWNGLLVEIQYRTKAQHAWATANEIAGSMTGGHSKFGRGSKEQKDFFRLASEIIARTEEGKKSCYSNLTNLELYKAFNKVEKDIRLLKGLKNLKIVSEHGFHGYDILKNNIILIYKENESENTISFYSNESFDEAKEKYFELEKKYSEKYGEKADVVFVRAPTEESLRQAYKNYFSDAKDFVQLVKSGLEKLKSPSFHYGFFVEGKKLSFFERLLHRLIVLLLR